jgi:hypothetical protein
LARKAVKQAPVEAPPSSTVVIKKAAALDLLARLGHGQTALATTSAADPVAGSLAPPPTPSAEARLNAATGCRTSEVAFAGGA